nr:hypothetical protein BaRGS_013951 [Batillaria attramentaria]
MQIWPDALSNRSDLHGRLAGWHLHDAGVTHYFCATEMDPPFMQRGQYLVTRDAQNTCYECVCEDEIGMACCESERPVMHV